MLSEISLSRYLEIVFQEHVNICAKKLQKREDHYERCQGGLSYEHIALYFVQITRGVAFFHTAGYVHGDLKRK